MKHLLSRYGWIFRSAAFAVLFVFLFVQCSYLFRRNADNAKYNMEGFALEPAAVDVVCIGGSSTFVFWTPLQAFEEQGIASYNYAGNAMSSALMRNLLIESRKTQDAKLYVLDIRALYMMQIAPEYYSESYMRNYTDNLPYSLNRTRMISYALEKDQIQPENRLSCYLDLILYHGNWRELGTASLSKSRNVFKGFGFFEPPIWKDGTYIDCRGDETRGEIRADVKEVLTDLLEYCRGEALNALFLIPAIPCHDAPMHAFYNTVSDLVEEYGYTFLNANDHFEEIGLDIKTDYYDNNHVDVLGAEKYTRFVASYLKEHYDLPDRREDADYAQWWEDLVIYQETFASAKNAYLAQIAAEGDSAS